MQPQNKDLPIVKREMKRWILRVSEPRFHSISYKLLTELRRETNQRDGYCSLATVARKPPNMEILPLSITNRVEFVALRGSF